MTTFARKVDLTTAALIAMFLRRGGATDDLSYFDISAQVAEALAMRIGPTFSSTDELHAGLDHLIRSLSERLTRTWDTWGACDGGKPDA